MLRLLYWRLAMILERPEKAFLLSPAGVPVSQNEADARSA